MMVLEHAGHVPGRCEVVSGDAAMVARQADQVSQVPFGTLVRRYRVAAGLTQAALAKRAGISVRRLGGLERGMAHRPRQDTVLLLAEALGLSPAEVTAFREAAQRPRSVALVEPVPAGSDAPPFVGRAQELALLDRHLAGQGPPLLLFAGEPGIGKTRLLIEAASRARAQGWCVLHGGCQRQGGQMPYAPLLEALQYHLHELRPTELRQVLQGCAWLVKLLPELDQVPIEPLQHWRLSPDQERRLMFGAVGRFLTNVAHPAGTLLVLDDLQWAGSDALNLLANLVRSTRAGPLRVLGAYRDTELSPEGPLATLLADLAHAGLAEHHGLTTLTPKECGHLLEGILEQPVAKADLLWERLAQRSGGIPFFVLSCVQALQTADGTSTGQNTVPWSVV
jgi:transcriptional regulator with XRE-family HTH domain